MRDPDHSYCLHLERLAENKIKELEAENDILQRGHDDVYRKLRKTLEEHSTLREVVSELYCFNPITGKRDGKYCVWEGKGKCRNCTAADRVLLQEQDK